MYSTGRPLEEEEGRRHKHNGEQGLTVQIFDIQSTPSFV
jgi:hypothetical protein